MKMCSWPHAGSVPVYPVPLPEAKAALAGVDAYDHPAILLGGDTAPGRETRSILQSLGFDVLQGAAVTDCDEEPLLVVMDDFLAHPQNRRAFDRVCAHWPTAPVFTVAVPSEAGSAPILAHL